MGFGKLEANCALPEPIDITSDPSGTPKRFRLWNVRRFNPRRVKVHRSYTVEEVASLFGAHKNTVRNWLREGLPKVDDRRPILVLGRQLASFVHARRQHRWQRVPPWLLCPQLPVPTVAVGTPEYLPTASVPALEG